MRGGNGEEPTQHRGDGSTRLDGLHSVSGGGHGDGGQSEAQGPGAGAGRTNGGDEGRIPQAPWFAPIEDEEMLDCPGGVCPVPWAVEDSSVFTIQERPQLQEDVVNHPSHYTDGGIETIEAIEAALTNEEFRGYCKGNCMKYIWRERHKGGTESLKKAQWYLNRLIELDETQNG
jgi:hypothetical protein